MNGVLMYIRLLPTCTKSGTEIEDFCTNLGMQQVIYRNRNISRIKMDSK